MHVIVICRPNDLTSHTNISHYQYTYSNKMGLGHEQIEEGGKRNQTPNPPSCLAPEKRKKKKKKIKHGYGK